MLRAFLRIAIWPLAVLGTTAAYAWGFATGHTALTLLLVPTGVVGVLVLLERVLPVERVATLPRDPQLRNDLGHGFVGQGVGVQLGELLFVSTAAILAARVGETFGGNLWPTGWPVAAQGLALVVLADGLETVRHRFEHISSRLWPVHALHHHTDRLHVLKSGRGHPLDMLLRALCVYAPLALIGVPENVLVWYAAAVTVLGPVAHANLDLRVPALAHRLLMTPHVHRIHHAADLACSRANYANVLPAWDMLLGSYRHPDRTPPPVFGSADPVPPGFLAQLADPFVRWSRRAAA